MRAVIVTIGLIELEQIFNMFYSSVLIELIRVARLRFYSVTLL